MFGDLWTGLSAELGRCACSTAFEGTGERATPLGLADATRRGHISEEPIGCICSIGDELRCVRGTIGPRVDGAAFRSTTGVSEGLSVDRVLAPVLGSK